MLTYTSMAFLPLFSKTFFVKLSLHALIHIVRATIQDTIQDIYHLSLKDITSVPLCDQFSYTLANFDFYINNMPHFYCFADIMHSTSLHLLWRQPNCLELPLTPVKAIQDVKTSPVKSRVSFQGKICSVCWHFLFHIE